MPPLVSTWVQDLWRARSWKIEQLDAIKRTFGKLRTSSQRWPGMTHFLSAWREVANEEHRMHDNAKFQLEWHKHVPRNRSVIARAHARFNAMRQGIPIPPWTEADDDVTEPEIQAVIEQLERTERTTEA